MHSFLTALTSLLSHKILLLRLILLWYAHCSFGFQIPLTYCYGIQKSSLVYSVFASRVYTASGVRLSVRLMDNHISFPCASDLQNGFRYYHLLRFPSSRTNASCKVEYYPCKVPAE